MTPARLIFVFRTPPYSTPTAQEGLDALMAAAIFDQAVAVIFMGDGVFQLHNNQAPSNGKNQMKMLQSLAMYDIDQVFVQSSALHERHMLSDNLSITCTPLSDQAIHHMMSNAAHVFSF